MNLPCCEACERNKHPIYKQLQIILAKNAQVLEIASGTGQHANYFAEHLPSIIWQPSDLPEKLEGIRAWHKKTGLSNVLEPIALDVNQTPWQLTKPYNVVYVSNFLHITPWQFTVNLFSNTVKFLQKNGKLIIYGPFNYDDNYTSKSNEEFDRYLKTLSPEYAIRDFAKVNQLAEQNGLNLVSDIEMPANNRLLVWSNSLQK